MSGRCDTVELLLEFGADPLVSDDRGHTCLTIAARAVHVPMMTSL